MEIKNKKAGFLYELTDSFTCGIVLTGTEIKSLRAGKSSFSDAYCLFINGEMWLRGLHISEYSHRGYSNHEPKRDRKLLLKRRELDKLHGKVKEKGFSIVPTKIFINEAGRAKIEISLARGKTIGDKRQTLKQRDTKREIKDLGV